MFLFTVNCSNKVGITEKSLQMSILWCTGISERKINNNGNCEVIPQKENISQNTRI